MIVKHNRVAGSTDLTSTAEAGPDGRDAVWSEKRGSRFVEDLEPLVNDLDILRRADSAIGVRRRAIAAHAGERDAIEIGERPRHVRIEEAKKIMALNDAVGFVVMSIRDFRVLVRLVLGLAIGFSPGWQLAQRR